MQTWRKPSFIHWLALAVMLWGFLLPSVSQALGLNAAAWHSVTDEVCSASGHSVPPVDFSSGDASHPGADSHCPLCTLHTASGAPAPALDLSFELSQPAHWVPVLFLQARASRFAWVQRPAQAPPQRLPLI
jgi:hypothetical protein